MRQGDPLSPYIFNLVIDPTIESLNNDNNIGGTLDRINSLHLPLPMT